MGKKVAGRRNWEGLRHRPASSPAPGRPGLMPLAGSSLWCEWPALSGLGAAFLGRDGR